MSSTSRRAALAAAAASEVDALDDIIWRYVMPSDGLRRVRGGLTSYERGERMRDAFEVQHWVAK